MPAALGDAEFMRAGHFVAKPDTPGAQNTAFVIERDQGPQRFGFRFADFIILKTRRKFGKFEIR